MLFLMMLLGAADASATAASPLDEDPVMVVCPTEPTAIPPFGESCDAKAQAKRISEILGMPASKATLSGQRYRILGDGRTIVQENGNVVAVASPCLLPTDEKPKELHAGFEVPVDDKPVKETPIPPGSSQSITKCKSENFAVQFSAGQGAGN